MTFARATAGDRLSPLGRLLVSCQPPAPMGWLPCTIIASGKAGAAAWLHGSQTEETSPAGPASLALGPRLQNGSEESAKL